MPEALINELIFVTRVKLCIQNLWKYMNENSVTEATNRGLAPQISSAGRCSRQSLVWNITQFRGPQVGSAYLNKVTLPQGQSLGFYSEVFHLLNQAPAEGLRARGLMGSCTLQHSLTELPGICDFQRWVQAAIQRLLSSVNVQPTRNTTMS